MVQHMFQVLDGITELKNQAVKATLMDKTTATDLTRLITAQSECLKGLIETTWELNTRLFEVFITSARAGK